MSDGDALLRAVLAHPAEDTPRLVYADWLDENGQPDRAEFIRVGCEAVKWGCSFAQTKEQPGWKHNCGTDDTGYWRCTKPRFREQDLWDANARAWFPLLDTFRMGKASRGFVSELHCTAADWIEHADAILAAHPVTKVVWTRFTLGDRWELLGLYRDRIDPAGLDGGQVAARIWKGITFTLPS